LTTAAAFEKCRIFAPESDILRAGFPLPRIKEISMQNIRNLSDDEYAKYGLLVMYSWDMCNAGLSPTSAAIDPRIAADGWIVKGIITGADDVIASSPNGIRIGMIRPGPDRVRYGYLAQKSADNNLYAAVIRGTDGAEEWIDDFDFFSASKPPLPGRVESGFADIYFSMQYWPLDNPGAAPVKLSDGIRGAVGDANVVVLGHSLGATLAEALAYELADPNCLGASRVGAVMFASPKLGDASFIAGFQRRLTNYDVINYEYDIVPLVPPVDVTHLDIYHTLPNCRVINASAATAVINNGDKGCCHHIIDYIAMLSPTEYSRASTAPGWTADDAQCAKCVISLRVPPPAISTLAG
jgi:triacylglycerol lipase